VSKLKVLISHAHDEKALAEAWSTLIADGLMGAVETWFSSDMTPGGGIGLGKEWRGHLYEKLAESNFIIAIQTPISAARPWIMWECGVASGIDRERGIIPIVFGMGRGDLANPLSSYQVYSGEDAGQVREVLERLAKEAGLSPKEHHLEAPLKAYLEKVSLHRPRRPLGAEQMAIWRTRFEELIRSGREAEVLAKRQAMYASFGATFQPVDPTLHELLSKILLDQKHYQEAIEEVDYALKLVGDDVDLLHRKALALVELQSLPEAEALIGRIVNLRHDLRDNPEIATLEGRIHRERWMVTGEQKDLDRAYEAYLRAYQADPSQYYPGINAAGLALRRGDTAQAEHLLRRVPDTCRALQARDVVSYWVDFTAGEVQLGLEDVTAALVEYERGVARSPGPPPRDRSSALGGARRMIEAKGLQQSVADEIRRVLGIL